MLCKQGIFLQFLKVIPRSIRLSGLSGKWLALLSTGWIPGLQSTITQAVVSEKCTWPPDIRFSQKHFLMSAFTKKKIGCPHTLGEKLTRARKLKSLELRQVEQDTKVAFKYLQALERGQYDQLPASIYTRGFLVRYATLLDLPAATLLADYEHELTCFRQARKNHQGVLLANRSKQDQPGLLRPSITDQWLKHPNRFLVTPGILWGGIISLFLVAVLGYMWFQVVSFAAAPPLEVVTPGSALKVTVQQVEVAGITDPSAQITINNQPVAVDLDGHFRQQVQLVDGMNTIEIAAVNKAEKQTLKTLQLMADLPKPPTTIDTPALPATSEGIKE